MRLFRKFGKRAVYADSIARSGCSRGCAAFSIMMVFPMSISPTGLKASTLRVYLMDKFNRRRGQGWS